MKNGVCDFGDSNNYVFDTNVLNLIAIKEDVIASCKETLNLGFSYFMTDVQERELNGAPDRSQAYDIDEAWHPSKYLSEVKSLISTLNMKYISCVMLLLKDFGKLDGSMRFLPESGPRYEMFSAIHNNNPKHLRDATTAEAAVFHHCKLVTNDHRFRNRMNAFYPGSAISYDEFIQCVRSSITKNSFS